MTFNYIFSAKPLKMWGFYNYIGKKYFDHFPANLGSKVLLYEMSRLVLVDPNCTLECPEELLKILIARPPPQKINKSILSREIIIKSQDWEPLVQMLWHKVN